MKSEENKKQVKKLKLLSVSGFTGKVKHGLHLASSKELVYPIGNNIGIWDWKASERSGCCRHSILKGHKSPIKALAVSSEGDIIASAEEGPAKHWATVIIWSLKNREEIGRHSTHQEQVVDLTIGANDRFIFSLGGEVDGKLIAWDVNLKKPICSASASEVGIGIPYIVRAAPITSTLLGVCGRRNLKVFSMDETTQSLSSANVNVGLLDRHFTDLKIDETESFMYCTSTTGDIAKVRLNTENGKVSSVSPVLIAVMAPKPFTRPFVKSTVRESLPAINGFCLVGDGGIVTGDSKGTIRGFIQEHTVESRTKSGKVPSSSLVSRAHGSIKIVRPKDPTSPVLKQIWSLETKSSISSLCLRNKTIVVGTYDSKIHELFLGTPKELQKSFAKPIISQNNFVKEKTKSIKSNKCRSIDASQQTDSEYFMQDRHCAPPCLEPYPPPSRLLSTCHPGAIYDVVFPRNVSDLVVTAGEFGVRVWNVRNLKELLSVNLPGNVCKCCTVSPDLSTIITGWVDGKIRGIGAESGDMKWTLDEAHHKCVNCVISIGQKFLLSGGADGRVRLWSLSKNNRPGLLESGREHRGEVTSMAMDADEKVVLSCGGDGLCIIWNVPSLEKRVCLKTDTVFLGGTILSRCEIVTVSSDGSVLVWDKSEGSLLADLRITRRPVTAIDSSINDKLLITAEESGIVKVWNWIKGRVVYEGLVHSGSNSKVKISPDNEIIVSADLDGCLIIWKAPKMK